MTAEHALPRALGAFYGFQPLQDRLCRNCNTAIGDRIELEFLRSGVVGFFRWVIGVDGRNGPGASPYYRGAHGIPPLLMRGRAPGYEEEWLWESDPGTQDVRPLRQVVMEHAIVGRRPVAIHEWMRDQPDLLRNQIADLGLANGRPVRVFATPDEREWVLPLVTAATGYELTEDFVVEGPETRIELVVDVQASPAFFRAIAKIALHFALTAWPDLSGAEPEFGPIRSFIWDGSGEIADFVRQLNHQYVENFARGARPKAWMHVAAAERSYDGGIVAHVQLFAGPQSMPLPYRVFIGRDPRRLVTRLEKVACQFILVPGEAPKGFDGLMVDACPEGIVRLARGF